MTLTRRARRPAVPSMKIFKRTGHKWLISVTSAQTIHSFTRAFCQKMNEKSLPPSEIRQSRFITSTLLLLFGCSSTAFDCVTQFGPLPISARGRIKRRWTTLTLISAHLAAHSPRRFYLSTISKINSTLGRVSGQGN